MWGSTVPLQVGPARCSGCGAAELSKYEGRFDLSDVENALCWSRPEPFRLLGDGDGRVVIVPRTVFDLCRRAPDEQQESIRLGYVLWPQEVP